MELLSFDIIGVSPILMNSPQGMLVTATKRKKEPQTQKQRIPPPEEEAESGTYRLPDRQLYMPTEAFRQGIIRVAAKGRKDIVSKLSLASIIKGALFILQPEAPLVHPDTGEPITDYEIDVRRCVPRGQGSVLRARPLIRNWATTIHYEYDSDMVAPELIESCQNVAGQRAGIGNYRPEKAGPYGRYVAKLRE